MRMDHSSASDVMEASDMEVKKSGKRRTRAWRGEGASAMEQLAPTRTRLAGGVGRFAKGRSKEIEIGSQEKKCPPCTPYA